MGDIETINLELILADAETVSKRLGTLEKDVRAQKKEAMELQAVLKKLLPHLEAGQLANSLELTKEERLSLKEVHLLTMKPFLYVCNKKQDGYNLDEHNDERWQELLNFFETSGAEYVVVDAGMEHELKDLAEDEKTEFRREYGAQDSGVESLIELPTGNLD